MSIEVHGLAGVLAGLAAKAAEIAAVQPVALGEGAEEVRAAWVGNIESEGLVLTGAYRDSVHVEHGTEGVAIKSDVPYGTILEYGDSRQAAHPVAQRALEEHEDAILDRIANRVREVVR